jgi:hypothetical protein
MKSFIKNRLEKLEGNFSEKTGHQRFVKVIYDPSIPDFDSQMLGIDADVILMVPDNGRRYPHQQILDE